jgi:glutathione S-transferase
MLAFDSMLLIFFNLHTGVLSMLTIYGTPLSSPTNKVRYVANYLHTSYQFHPINLATAEQSQPDYLMINPFGKVPAMDDNGFRLGESNAIIRYLANKDESIIYPQELQQRAIVDQWIDYASQHVMLALGRIMFNTYFYKSFGTSADERSIQDGRKFIAHYLPIIDKQLSKNTFIAADVLTLADFVMLASLDTAELAKIDLNPFSYITAWRNELSQNAFYTMCHESYTSTFNRILASTTS